MKIFLSHASENKPLIREFKGYLAPGLSTWLDEREIRWGSDLAGSIKEAISDSDLLIIFIDSAAVKSQWVKDELKWAIEKEKTDNINLILPILMPGNFPIPDELDGILYLRLHDHNEQAIKMVADQSNLKILQILIDRIKSLAGLNTIEKRMGKIPVALRKKAEYLLDSVIEVSKVKNSYIKKRLMNALDDASQLTYVVVGSSQIYQHDQQIIKLMNADERYRATHPFIANEEAHYVTSAPFKSYMQSQIDASKRGIKISRLYILPNEDLKILSVAEKKHLQELVKIDHNMDIRCITENQLPIDNDLAQDFILFGDELLGVAVPRKGKMFGSEYKYSKENNSSEISKYNDYYDSLFESADPLNIIINSTKNKKIFNHNNNLTNVSNLARIPAFVLQGPINIDGIESQRLMIVLRTSGCTYDKNNQGCTMCDFKRHAIPKKFLSFDAMNAQLDHALEQSMFGGDDVTQIDLLTLGSFLHDNEVTDKFRTRTFKALSKITGLQKIVIESRAPYIKSNKLKKLKDLLREDQILEIGLGIESSDDKIRNEVLRKNLTDPQIRRAIKECKSANVEFLAYVLIGSMTLSGNAVCDDAVNSAEYIGNLCTEEGVKFRIAFEPIFITTGTELEKQFNDGSYKLVNLWQVIDVIKRTAYIGTTFVGLSDEGLSSHRIPSGCPKCTEILRDAIEDFNQTQSLTDINKLSCECQI